MWPFREPYITVDAAALEQEYDYIVVGGGTAGCVIASRLSEEPNSSVLVLERGTTMDTWQMRAPLMSCDLYSENAVPHYGWNCVPQKGTGGGEYKLVTGKGLGGGSRINAMLYTRGYPAEFDAWARAGRKGWSFDEIEPLFHRSERALGALSAQKHHGRNGVWSVQKHTKLFFSAYEETVKACQTLGLPFVFDVNSPEEPVAGCAELHTTVDERGERNSTFAAFLPRRLVRERKDRLHLCTSVAVQKLDITREEIGLRAQGVWFEREEAGGQRFYAKARKEVILCSGAIGSAQVLMLSGIGPAEHLESKGVSVVMNHPGVGNYLQDHLAVAVTWGVPRSESMHQISDFPLFAIWQLILYFFFTMGLFLAPITQISVFARTELLNDQTSASEPKSPKDVDSRTHIPDIELMAISNNANDIEPPRPGKHGLFSYLVALLQPESKGTVRLASTDAHDRPICDMGWFSDKGGQDRRVMHKGLRLAGALVGELKKQGYPVKDVYVPKLTDSDADLDQYINKRTRTAYHYSSTCRMAPMNDSVSPGVVDDELRVHGVKGLRVADASIFPRVLAGHLQAPVVMVAEKCVDLIRGRK